MATVGNILVKEGESLLGKAFGGARHLLANFGTKPAEVKVVGSAGNDVRVAETARQVALRRAFARSGGNSFRVRPGSSAINDIISENARNPNMYGRQGRADVPWERASTDMVLPRGTGASSRAVMRSHVKQLARKAEEAQKLAVAQARSRAGGGGYRSTRAAQQSADRSSALSRSRNPKVDSAYRGVEADITSGMITARQAIERNQKIEAADAAVRQQHRMDAAASVGQITPAEIMKQNRILMPRRRRIGI
jgi:hypothetical protein